MGIFLHCLDDTADLEVVKVAAEIVQRLQSFLDRYNYMEETNSKPKNGHSISGASATAVLDSTYVQDHSNLAFNAENGEWNNAADVEGAMTMSTPSPVSGSVPTTTSDVTTRTPSAAEMDVVIDGIVEAQDVNLLASAYAHQLQVDAEKGREGGGDGNEASDARSPQVAEDYYKQFAKVTPRDFLRQVYALNLERLAENRSTWIAQIENYESLLDDILLGFDEENLQANDADCY